MAVNSCVLWVIQGLVLLVHQPWTNESGEQGLQFTTESYVM